MINFIKNDKYISYINIIVILLFIFLNINYYWFLIIELTIISLYFIFMIYRFYLRTRIEHDDFMTLKELYKTKFQYKDYSDIYEEEDDFNLKIVEYKKLLDVILINILRMDKKLNIESYKYIDEGLELLESISSGNSIRKTNYDLVNDSIKIIKKHYNKDCYRKESIKKHNKLLTILILLSLVPFILLIMYLITNKIALYSLISSIYILILFVIALIISTLNKE